MRTCAGLEQHGASLSQAWIKDGNAWTSRERPCFRGLLPGDSAALFSAYPHPACQTQRGSQCARLMLSFGMFCTAVAPERLGPSVHKLVTSIEPGTTLTVTASLPGRIWSSLISDLQSLKLKRPATRKPIDLEAAHGTCDN